LGWDAKPTRRVDRRQAGRSLFARTQTQSFYYGAAGGFGKAGRPGIW